MLGWPARRWSAQIDLWREIDLRYWFFYDRSYNDLGDVHWCSGLVRLVLLALATVLSAAFFVLVPRRETWMTGFGQSTMYVYLLHSFVLYPIRETGVLRDEASSLTWLVSMVLACIAISIALSSPLVRRIFHPLIEPNPRWLFADGDAASRASPARIRLALPARAAASVTPCCTAVDPHPSDS